MDAWIGNRRGRTVALVIALVALLAVPALAGGAARVFKKGSRGDRVVVIQRALGLTEDGVFGKATKRAVVRFQRGRGLTADGLVGPATWSAIRALRTRQQHAATRRPASRSSGRGRVRSRGGI